MVSKKDSEAGSIKDEKELARREARHYIHLWVSRSDLLFYIPGLLLILLGLLEDIPFINKPIGIHQELRVFGFVFGMLLCIVSIIFAILRGAKATPVVSPIQRDNDPSVPSSSSVLRQELEKLYKMKSHQLTPEDYLETLRKTQILSHKDYVLLLNLESKKIEDSELPLN